MITLTADHNKSFLVSCLLCICLQGCHSIIFGDVDMKGYEVLIRFYDGAVISDELQRIVDDFAQEEGFIRDKEAEDKPIPVGGKCMYFRKDLGTRAPRASQASRFIILTYCQHRRSIHRHADTGDSHVAVYSWYAEPASVKVEIERLGQMIYDRLENNGIEKMTITKQRIGFD